MKRLLAVIVMFITSPAFGADVESCKVMLSTPEELLSSYAVKGERLACAKILHLFPYSDAKPTPSWLHPLPDTPPPPQRTFTMDEIYRAMGGPPPPADKMPSMDRPLVTPRIDNDWTILITPSGKGYWNSGNGYISGPDGMYTTH